MIIQRIWPLANDHFDGPTSCKWSSVTLVTLVTFARIQIQSCGPFQNNLLLFVLILRGRQYIRANSCVFCMSACSQELVDGLQENPNFKVVTKSSGCCSIGGGNGLINQLLITFAKRYSSLYKIMQLPQHTMFKYENIKCFLERLINSSVGNFSANFPRFHFC